MKLFFTALLLVLASAIKAQQLNTLEYYFDTDPGYGNGSHLAISGTSADADYSLTMPALSAGLHSIYMRIKDNGGVWGTTYQQLVFINSGTVGASAITTAEYYFDTDPGIGKATTISLNSNSLDSSLKLNTTGLSNGTHILVIRLKNSNNAWSTSYENDVNIYSGIDSIPQITSLEIFNDSDKGINKNTIIPLTKTALLDTTFSILIPDNGTDNSTLGLRLHNQAGQTGNVALQDISLCDLYKPQAGFRTVRFGNSYSFVDTSKYNPAGEIIWQIDNSADKVLNSPVFNYTFPPGFNGSKNVMEIVGTGCRKDTLIQTVQTQSIEYISPHFGALSNDFVLNIFGGDLDTTTTVYLQHGTDIVYPSDKAIFENKMLNLIFDFHTSPSFGIATTSVVYDLHVKYPNGYDTVLAQSVTIVNKGACDILPILNHSSLRSPDCQMLESNNDQVLIADLSGPENIRTGVWNDYTLHLSNQGVNLAKEFPYWLLIPANNDVQFDLNVEIPAAYGTIVPLDSLPPLYTPIDTVISGTRYQYKLYGFYFPYLSPGETRDINFKLRNTVPGNQQINYWVSKSMFGSPWAFNWFQCLWDRLGYVDAIGCATGTVDFFRNKAGFDDSYKSDMSQGKLYEALHAARTLGYSVAGVGLSCAGLKTASAATKLSQNTIANIARFEGLADKFKSSIDNKGLAACYDLLANGPTKGKDLITFFSSDPNSITGNSQFDSSQHFIDNYSPQHYTVSFENKPAATAPAQHVSIVDTLNKAKVDFSSFSFTGYRISDSSYMVPQYRKQIFQTTTVKNRNNLKVQFIGSFDTLSGIVHCDFYTLDSTGTQTIPATSIDGFLPPNVDGVSGAGQVSYQVSAKDINTLDTFTNKAIIIFDNNEPIQTNQWMNTVDTTAPTGKITNAVVLSDTTVKLFVQHADIGSGFQYNSFFVKSQGDSMFRRIANTASDSVIFTGTKGLTYQFFTQAVDNVGNIQHKDSVADVTVVLAQALPLKLLSFTAKIVDKKTQLNWVTTNEVNTDRFEVERSTDGQHFTKIGAVPAANRSGTDNYSSLDNDPATGENYYRLKQYDIDGNYTYSKIIKLYYDLNSFISIAPNPAKEYVDIQTSGKISQVLISDVSGKKVKAFSTAIGSRYSLTGISKGLYLLQIMMDGELHNFKLVVE